MNKLYNRLALIGSLLIIIPSIYISHKVNNSLKEQLPLYVEYNNFPDQIITPTAEVLLFEDQIPNITSVTIPIKLAKARYLFLEGKYEKAKKLINQGKMHNPFLGFGDVLLSRIYLKENKLDSAVFFGKQSMIKLPKNESHVTFYQITQERVQDLEEINRVFKEILNLKSEAIWQNHLITIAYIKLNRKLEFSEDDKEYLKQAIKYYPNNTIIKTAEKIINYGGDLILIANEYDSQATKNFNEKKYTEAIDFWLKAIQIIPNDEAYYLNIAHSYILLEDTKNAEKYFSLIEKENLKGNSGKFEFLKAINNLKLDRILVACDYAKFSKNLGYKNAQLILNQYNCISN